MNKTRFFLLLSDGRTVREIDRDKSLRRFGNSKYHKVYLHPDGAIYTTKNWLSSRQLDVVLKARNEKQ